MSRETKVQAIPDIRDDNVTEVLRAIKNVLQVREGHLGDVLDQNVTLRDLTDLSLLRNGGFSVVGGTRVPVVIPSVEDDGYNPNTDYTTPPAPVNLTANATFSNVYLAWLGGGYRNHAYTEIWRASTNNLGNAVLVGTSASNVYADAAEEGQTYYYWIRFVSVANITGPYNSTNGTAATTATSPGVLLDLLTGQITESQLYSTLGARIDLIDGPATLTGSAAYRVYQEQLARIAADTSLGSSITTLQSTTSTQATQITSLQTRTTTAESNIGTLQSTTSSQATSISSLTTRVSSAESNITSLQSTTSDQATSINSLTTRVGSAESSITSLQSTTSSQATSLSSLTTRVGSAESSITSLQSTTSSQASSLSSLTTRVGSAESNITSLQSTTSSQATSITNLSSTVSGHTTTLSTQASSIGGLQAQYTVKIDSNGYVTGYGLASTAINGTPTSSFIVRADSFSISNPAGPSIAPATPFIVRTTSTTINGETVGPGVYITDAFIQNGTITSAKIGSLTADKITTGTLTAVIGVNTGKLYGGVNLSNSFGATNFGTGFFLGEDGGAYKFRAGSYDKNITWDGSDLTVKGIIYANGGLIGGVVIDSVGLRSGQTAWNTGSGFYLGADGKFSLGTANSKYLTWDGSTLKFSGNLDAASGTFSGALNAATGTFAGSLAAGTVDLNAVVGQSFSYATAGTWTVVTMPYTGTVRVKLLGGGGGGGGGQGNTDARTENSGLSGSYGNQYTVTLTNVPQGYVVKVIIGSGGAGGYAGADGSAGNPTYLRIEDPYGTLYALYSASGGAGGGHYRYNDNPDSGLTGGLVARANRHNFRFPDAGDGSGWGSGQTGLPAPDIAGSAGGLGGFYDKEVNIYWGSLTESRRSELNGGNGVRGGGGGGGMATVGRGFSNGGLIGYRSAVYDSYWGGAESNGGNGGDGYAFVEIFNPNGVVLSSEFQTLKSGLQADFSVGLSGWSIVWSGPVSNSGTVDLVAQFGHGYYYYAYSAGASGAINPLQAYGWTKPTGDTPIAKYYTAYDENIGAWADMYLRQIWKANFKVVGAI